MTNLFCWFYTVNRTPEGVPLPLDTSIVEKFNPKKPLQDFNFSWVRYNYYFMPFPPVDEKLKLPEKLYLVIDKVSDPKFDFLNKKAEYKIVSKKFFEFLKKHNINQGYEEAKLILLNKKGKDVSQQEYYLLRFGKFDDDLFDFNEESKISASLSGSAFLYPDMKLKNPTDKGVFVLDSFCYKNCLILSEEAKNEILENFYKPEIYPVQEFPTIFNESMNWKK